MKNTSLFEVSAEEKGKTLAAALRGWIPGQSWSQVKKMLHTHRVLVNDNLCLDGARRLTLKEVVKVLPDGGPPPPRDELVNIVYFDDHIVVVDKPAGMTTLRRDEERGWSGKRKNLQPTLDEALARILPRLLKSRRRQAPGKSLLPVHRIDRDTSGLLVFARSRGCENRLAQQFRAHTTHRRYLCIAHGNVPAQKIVSYLVRDRGDGERGSTEDKSRGRKAITYLEPVEQLGDYTLVRCRLETGRTHQIRIHLAEAGHSVCGDKRYRGPFGGKQIYDASGAPRHALHAAELGFIHPGTGQEVRYESPLPEDMQTLLERLRKD